MADDGNQQRWSDVRIPLIAVGIVVAIPAIATAISQAGGPFPQFAQLEPTAQGLVGLGIWGCVAVAVLTIGLIVCAEIRARAAIQSATATGPAEADATRAEPAPGRLAGGTAGAPGAGGAGLWAVVQRRGTDPWLVVSVHRDGDEDTYLLARDDAHPIWVTSQEVVGWQVRPGA